jgi:hypothetical protein
MVQEGGLEPPASGSTDQRSNQLIDSCASRARRRLLVFGELEDYLKWPDVDGAISVEIAYRCRQTRAETAAALMRRPDLEQTQPR